MAEYLLAVILARRKRQAYKKYITQNSIYFIIFMNICTEEFKNLFLDKLKVI